MSELYALYDDAGGIFDYLNLVLMGGSLSAPNKASLVTALDTAFVGASQKTRPVLLGTVPSAAQITTYNNQVNSWQSYKRDRLRGALWLRAVEKKVDVLIAREQRVDRDTEQTAFAFRADFWVSAGARRVERDRGDLHRCTVLDQQYTALRSHQHAPIRRERERGWRRHRQHRFANESRGKRLRTDDDGKSCKACDEREAKRERTRDK